MTTATRKLTRTQMEALARMKTGPAILADLRTPTIKRLRAEGLIRRTTDPLYRQAEIDSRTGSVIYHELTEAGKAMVGR